LGLAGGAVIGLYIARARVCQYHYHTTGQAKSILKADTEPKGKTLNGLVLDILWAYVEKRREAQ
jgi:hypothetical protein